MIVERHDPQEMKALAQPARISYRPMSCRLADLQHRIPSSLDSSSRNTALLKGHFDPPGEDVLDNLIA